ASDKDAYHSAIDEIERKFSAASNRMEAKLFRGRGGWIGRLKSGTNLAGTEATLDDPADAFNFYVDQLVTFATTDGTSGALLDAGATLTVTEVDRENGKVTFGAALNTITGITDTSYMFVD